MYAGWNAAMTSAALRAAPLVEDDALAEFAIKSMERVLLACYRPGSGVAHYLDGEAHVRGLLHDQVAMTLACLDAYDATGKIPYEMMAEELMRYASRTMWDEQGGGFFDRAPADEDECVGRMRIRLKSFATNCEAAVALGRLADASGEHEFRAQAEATLAAIAPEASRHGPQAAHYVLAARALRVR